MGQVNGFFLKNFLWCQGAWCGEKHFFVVNVGGELSVG